MQDIGSKNVYLHILSMSVQELGSFKKTLNIDLSMNGLYLNGLYLNGCSPYARFIGLPQLSPSKDIKIPIVALEKFDFK